MERVVRVREKEIGEGVRDGERGVPTSPSLDSRRSSFLQEAWMSPASARI